MINLNLVELFRVSGGVINMSGDLDQSSILIVINNYNNEQHNILNYKDLTFTLNGCNYLGSSIISGGYYSGYKVEIKTLAYSSDEKNYTSHYLLTKA